MSQRKAKPTDETLTWSTARWNAIGATRQRMVMSAALKAWRVSDQVSVVLPARIVREWMADPFWLEWGGITNQGSKG